MIKINIKQLYHGKSLLNHDTMIILLLLSGILEFFWALFFFKVRGVAGAAKNENQK